MPWAPAERDAAYGAPTRSHSPTIGSPLRRFDRGDSMCCAVVGSWSHRRPVVVVRIPRHGRVRRPGHGERRV